MEFLVGLHYKFRKPITPLPMCFLSWWKDFHPLLVIMHYLRNSTTYVHKRLQIPFNIYITTYTDIPKTARQQYGGGKQVTQGQQHPNNEKLEW